MEKTLYQITRALTMRVMPDGALMTSASASRIGQRMAPEALMVLCAFAKPICIDEAFADVQSRFEVDRAGFDDLVNGLITQNVITPLDETEYRPAEYGGAWASEHYMMLRDTRRVQSYQMAIERAVRGRVVLEIGCGTGILSFFAARAGARRVYAIEETTIADVAEELFKVNEVSGVVSLIRGNSMDVQLPEHAEVLIHEVLGNDPIGENMLPVIADARTRLLCPDARLIPNRVDVSVVGVELTDPIMLVDETREALADLGRLYNVNFEPLTRRLSSERAQQSLPGPPRLETKHLLTREANVCTLDLRHAGPDDEPTFNITLEVTRPGPFAGVAILFRAHLDERIIIGTQPWMPATSWGVAWCGFPRSQIRAVEVGERIRIMLRHTQYINTKRFSVSLVS